MPLSSIVNVQITRQTQSIPEANFGFPMVLGTHKSFNELIKVYSTLAEVADDFTANQPEYISAQAIFGQDPCPEQMYIGRRDVDEATLTVITSVLGKIYNVNINNSTATVNSSSVQQLVKVVMSADFVANNLINVVFNNIVLGTITSVIDFDINFVSLNSILATVNNIALTPVTFNTDQATTIGDLATEIALAAGVFSATVTGVKQITVVFTATGANTVNSVITTLGSTQPIATISQGGFSFDTDQATTMGDIITALLLQPNVATAVLDPDDVTDRTLLITSVAGTLNAMNTFAVFLGSSQATATITNDSFAASIAKAMVVAINALSDPVTAVYTGTPDGTFLIDADVSGVPYTLSTDNNLTTVNRCLIEVTDVVVNQTYTVTLNGTNYSYTTDATIQTNEQIVAILVGLINANTGNSGITAVDNFDGTFYVSSAIEFYVSVTNGVFSVTKGILIAPYVATDIVSNTLDAIIDENNDWYALSCTDRTVAIVLAVAAWTEAQIKIFGTASDDPDIIDVAVGTDMTSIAAQLQNFGYVRTFCLYHQDADTDYPECAWFGKVLPFTPGSETWKFKTLSGVATSDLTTTQTNNALNKNCNTYEYIGGVGITQNGTMAQGEFIDIIRGVDWLQSTIQNFVYSTLVNLPKVPYTDSGITAIQAQVLKAIQLGIDNNFITDNPAPIVTVPKAADVPSVDKANRILKNVKFTVVLAGAIHAVEIRGIVTV